MSPIRAENRDRYPPDWTELAARLKAEAGQRCECDGRCGRPSSHLEADGRCGAEHGKPSPSTGTIVVLTIAHLDHVPEHNDRANLMVACQGCHLHYDRAHHAQTRAAAARAALEAAGQLELADALGTVSP